MDRIHPHEARRIGWASLAAGLLLASGVAVELVHPVQQPDGTIVLPGTFAVYVATWVAGSAALLRTVVALRRLTADGTRPRRRIPSALAVVGAALLLAFGAVAGLTGLVTGRPLEASFLLFASGLLLSVVGQVALGLGLHRLRVLGGWWAAPVVAAVAMLVGVAVPTDPWHDLGLLTSHAAWALLGLRLVLAARRVPTAEPALPDGFLAVRRSPSRPGPA